MIYQHPLAYLLGLEGIALLRGWAGDFDKDFVLERLAEVRRLLDDERLAGHPGVDVLRGTSVSGYRDWAATYDSPNTLFSAEEPVMHSILEELPVGVALDAACGTGRYARWLSARGHDVVGVDSSPDMLAVARDHLPDADLRVGDLVALPLEDASVDLAVSAVALSHVGDLVTAMAELARVVRPGGHVVLSDAHHELVLRGSVVKATGPSGEPGLVATHRHSVGDFVRAALAAGLEVRRCEEPTMGADEARRVRPPAVEAPVAGAELGEWADWPWSLTAVVPEAAWAAWAIPPVIVWHFQRPATSGALSARQLEIQASRAAPRASAAISSGSISPRSTPTTRA